MAEPMIAVLLTEQEFQLTVQLLGASQVPFGAAALASAVDAKFRNAQRVQASSIPEALAEESPTEESRTEATME